jgi:hypothetical protein
MSKTADLKKLAKLYKEFFYEAEYILKKEGTVTLLARDYSMLKEAAEKHKFNINKVHVLNQGKEIFNIVGFKRD